MRQQSQSGVRKLNAVLAAFLTLFFLIHAALGLANAITPISTHLKWLVWVGVGIMAVHVLLCAATTYTMFTDKKRPASARKRRHQILKWVTGGVLLALALFHMLADAGAAATESALAIGAIIALVAAIAVHGYTGTKSLTRDLDLPKQTRTPLRAGLIVLSVAVGVTALAAYALQVM